MKETTKNRLYLAISAITGMIFGSGYGILTAGKFGLSALPALITLVLYTLFGGILAAAFAVYDMEILDNTEQGDAEQ